MKAHDPETVRLAQRRGAWIAAFLGYLARHGHGGCPECRVWRFRVSSAESVAEDARIEVGRQRSINRSLEEQIKAIARGGTPTPESERT